MDQPDEQTSNQPEDRESLIKPSQDGLVGSQPLSPNDHMVMMLEMCKPESMAMIRRWVAALMIAPEDQREAIVLAVEKQIVEEFVD